MARSPEAPPRRLIGFLTLLVLLFLWSYQAGALAAKVAPGLRPGGVETGVEREGPPAGGPGGGGHGHGA
ncbi:hypothetical protein LUX12_15755 [Streptomyces somaliensis]|uniref:hypothetical protein n=1 Tax=Streptomyces somaliensis TaxID=78355 RepID=UPI0020CE6C69|nr:hypothetical protein [Streptomyces somaliensis]MCP9945915.1 hypothetical protein [Streptomyces somaliensis]MCP9973696.1 hypothetical protein [Streptomyces somaliensis]